MRQPAEEADVRSVAGAVAGIVQQVMNDPAYRVVLFGSWATGTPRRRSDIDIGIQGPRRIAPRHHAGDSRRL
jgi:predicted nucleotidyltransferase